MVAKGERPGFRGGCIWGGTAFRGLPLFARGERCVSDGRSAGAAEAREQLRKRAFVLCDAL